MGGLSDWTSMKTIPDRVHIPVSLECRVSVDRDVFRRQYVGVKINELTPLHPYHHFREKVMKAARMWIDDMRRQGHDLLTAESDIQVFGPYRSIHREGSHAPTWEPAPGMAKTFKSHVRGIGESANPDSADFVMKATFITHKARPVPTKEPASVS